MDWHCLEVFQIWRTCRVFQIWKTCRETNWLLISNTWQHANFTTFASMNKSIYHSSDMHGADNTNHTNSNPTTYQASVTTKAANQIQDHNHIQNVSRHLWQQRQSTQAKTTTLMMSIMKNLIYVNNWQDLIPKHVLTKTFSKPTLLDHMPW